MEILPIYAALLKAEGGRAEGPPSTSYEELLSLARQGQYGLAALPIYEVASYAPGGSSGPSAETAPSRTEEAVSNVPIFESAKTQPQHVASDVRPTGPAAPPREAGPAAAKLAKDSAGSVPDEVAPVEWVIGSFLSRFPEGGGGFEGRASPLFAIGSEADEPGANVAGLGDEPEEVERAGRMAKARAARAEAEARARAVERVFRDPKEMEARREKAREAAEKRSPLKPSKTREAVAAALSRDPKEEEELEAARLAKFVQDIADEAAAEPRSPRSPRVSEGGLSGGAGASVRSGSPVPSESELREFETRAETFDLASGGKPAPESLAAVEAQMTGTTDNLGGGWLANVGRNNVLYLWDFSGEEAVGWYVSSRGIVTRATGRPPTLTERPPPATPGKGKSPAKGKGPAK